MARIAMLVWNDFRHDARVLKEAQTLQAAGHDVCVYALLAPGLTPVEQTLDGGIRVVRLSRGPRQGAGPLGKRLDRYLALKIAGRLLTHLRLCWRLARHGADLVHAHDVNVLPTAWLAARLSGARLIYDAHEISTSREGYRRVRRLVAILEGALFPRVDGAITTTSARARFFARAYGVPRPLVLQNRPRLQIPPANQRIREELGLTQPWPIVLYQGGLQQGRGLEGLVRTMHRVPKAYLVLIGGGRLEPHLRALAAEPGLTSRVHFIATVPLADLLAYSASADIGVQPIAATCLNHITTDSNKLFEYVMAGLPVVASDLPEIRAVVRAHRLGELLPAGDETALAEALRRLVGSPGLRQQHRDNAHRARLQLNWESQENALLKLYDRVLQGAPSPAPDHPRGDERA